MFNTLEVTKVDGEAGGRQKWRLDRTLRFRMWLGSGKISVWVPAGFETDFASVPRWLWPIFPPTGKWCEAAVMHDYLYTTTCSRFLADALFREAMYISGVPWYQRVAMFYAVRVFGRKGRQ